MNLKSHDDTQANFGEDPTSSADDNVSLPLGIGEGPEENVSLDGEKPRKFNSGALLVVIVAVVAAVGLFSMRTLTRASASTEAPQQIEQSIDEFLNVVTKSGEAMSTRAGVLEVLSESYASRQVPLEDVQRNPFIIFEEAREAEPVGPRDPLSERRRDRQAQLERAANRLRVGMVVTGSQPMANINGRVVRVGEVVRVDGEAFRVVAITADRVDFVAEDEELEIIVEKSVSLRRE